MKHNNITYYILAVSIGFGIGLKVIPDSIVLIAYFAIILSAVVAYVNNRTTGFVVLFIIAAYLEPYSRTYLLSAPYLTLEYCIILIAVYTLFSKGFSAKYKYSGLIFFALFFLVELLSSARYINFRYTTVVLTQTAAMLSFLFVASKLRFRKEEVLNFLKTIFISALLLSAVIGVVYLRGDIQWTESSNFETSGGMGPVQISFYLAVGAFAGLYAAFMSSGITRLVNLFLSLAIVFIMILTFSRGGLYMLVLMLAVGFLLEKKRKHIILIIPLSLVAYWGIGFVGEFTEGKIIERYTQEGTSGRDLLAVYGWKMFLENPITGIGTANYYFEVSKREYLGILSGAHNEVIRALAEHGFLGGLLWILFFLASIFQFRKMQGFDRQIAMVFFLVFLASTFHNGLKLALQSLILLIAVSCRSHSAVTTRRTARVQKGGAYPIPVASVK